MAKTIRSPFSVHAVQGAAHTSDNTDPPTNEGGLVYVQAEEPEDHRVGVLWYQWPTDDGGLS